MTEKKVILCAILAIAIGIATIVPMERFMQAQSQVNAETASQPWFNVNVPYAYVNLDQSGANSTASWDGVYINGIANFTLTPAGMDLQGADAKIEYYQFQISSDQGPIANISYSVAYSIEKFPAGNNINDIPGIPGGGYAALNGGGDNSWTFANGIEYNGIPNYNGYCAGGSCFYQIAGDNLAPNTTNQTFTTGILVTTIFNYNGNNQNQAITELKNAKTLYIDVSRICSVSYNGNITVNTPSSNQVLQHIELTKTNGGFVYGTYTQGEAPFPMETPSNPTGAWETTPSPSATFIPTNSTDTTP
jgi:predicted small secreted protein